MGPQMASKDIYQIARTQILNELFKGDKFPKKISELDKKQLKKVKNHAIRYGHTIEEVLEAVLNSEVAFRAIVGKSPKRMDYFENTLITFLNSLDPVKIAKKLPKSGHKAKYVVNGKIYVGGGRRNDVKSLDIEVTFKNNIVIYLVHKYTMEDGGAQDNQFREAKETLRQVYNEAGKVGLILGAVLDGDYYTKKRLKGMTKLEQAQRENPDTIVCNYQTFEQQTKIIWDRKL